MASATSNDDRAPDLTEAVRTLQNTIRRFQDDVNIERQDVFVQSLGQRAAEDGSPSILRLAPANDDTGAQLNDLEEHIEMLEQQLRSQGRWRPLSDSPKTPIQNLLDISDLSNAINLLSHLITKTSRQKTPQPSFSAYSWTWDPAWHEFYTYVPSQQTYVYLSRWKLNEERNVWEHVSMANTNILPDVAAEMFGSWDDWAWDSVWKQWYLEVEEEGTDEQCHVFPSQWQVQDNGEWEYVGSIVP
jgi:hypothetical protein